MTFADRAIERSNILKQSLGEDFTVDTFVDSIMSIKIYRKCRWLWIVPYKKLVATIGVRKMYCADKETALMLGVLLPDLIVEILK